MAASVVVMLTLAIRASAHDGEHHGEPHDVDYYAFIDDFHTVHTTDGTGEIFLTLNAAKDELTYRIVLDGQLGLKQNPADRTEPDDIIGMHLHLSVEGTNGPHVLNIFGLSTYNVPAEEDADVVIDYANQIITGKWDLSDASRDPLTGELLPQFFPLTSKVITDWIDELDEGLLMVAVHTNETGFPAMAIHGHIHPVIPIPEPAGCVIFLMSLVSMLPLTRRSRRTFDL
jgi:hypothetical protein